MLSIRGSLVVFYPVGVLCVASLLAQQISSSNQGAKGTAEGGRSTYGSSCAGCHGLDGRGSDKGINISASAKVKNLSDPQVSGIISNGVPGTGMPAFHNLSDKQIRAVVGYLRSMQGKLAARTLPGDAKRGREVFFGKGECSSCHTISGEGGFLGPDLSVYGNGASAAAIRDEITWVRRTPQNGYRAAVLTTAEGDRLEGLIRNEDNFSIQLQTKDGVFYFFQKSELRKLDRLETSLMPVDYGERLSQGELDDLVSYLLSAAPNSGKSATSHDQKDDQ